MSGAMCGWTGRILRLDLSTGEAETLRLAPEVCAAELGGRGLAGHFLREHATRAADDPALPLVVAAGPLSASITPGAGRCHIATRSPLTGAVADASLGGRLGAELKRAGWDAVVITGRAEKPCGLEIDDQAARLVDASALADLETTEAYARLRGRRKCGSLLLSGPAADTGCLFASLLADGRHAAGRCGLGRAAGLKNLKYLAVSGTGRTSIADPAGLKAARADILRLAAASPALMGPHGLAGFGTGCLYDLTDARRMMPTDNFRATRFAAAGELNAHAFAARYQPRRHTCPGCHVACLRSAQDGRGLPEFEAMSHFTALIGNADMELALRASDLCGRLGLDPVSAAATLACHSEITGENMHGERVLALLRGMGTGRGPGAELAQGSARLAARQGRPELSMSVKGLELPAFDPRGAYGMALGCAVSTRGGCHQRAGALGHEILRKPVATDRFSFSGKARMVKIGEDTVAAAEALTVCGHLLLAASLEEYARAYSAVTGLSATAQDLLAAGERIDYRERVMNAQNGFTAAHDDLPARFFTEPGTGAPDLPVPPIPREDFLACRAAYYRIRGLTPGGLPTRKKAEALGLQWPVGLDDTGEGGA